MEYVIQILERESKILKDCLSTKAELRDSFADSAMLGILSNTGVKGGYETLAEMSYSIADAMLKQREL